LEDDVVVAPGAHRPNTLARGRSLDTVRDSLEKFRGAEMETVKPWFDTGRRVLEIGGGSGYQASLLAAWGCEVVSIDIPDRETPSKQYYPVQDYDGVNIPFADEYFDIVFSSNVLEHVQDLSSLLTEIHRILKPEGVAVHILPSSTWRLWTIVSHYGYLLKYLLKYLSKEQLPAFGLSTRVPTISETLDRRGLRHVLGWILFDPPHGEYPNALSELYYYSRWRWLAVFSRNGFKVERVTNNGLFYTGYVLFPKVSLKTRRKIAGFLGAAGIIFIMKK
jgi:ubiquinone/menaquinone biosynthesis C-methylase UbiE